MTPDTASHARLGTIERSGDEHVLRYERHLSHPVERVWAALTEPDQLATWLAAADELEPVTGGRITLRWLNIPDDRSEWDEHGVELGDDTEPGVAHGTITSLDRPRLIEYESHTMGRMRWELQEEEGGCRLTFTNTLKLPDGQPPEQTLAGWHIHLDHLAGSLAGHPVEWSTWTRDHMDAWGAIRDRYAAQLG